MRLHSGDRPFKCDQCAASFVQYSSFQKHKRVHDGQRPYVCDAPGCAKAFSQISNLIRHKRVHSGNRPHRCNECGRGFESEAHLTLHRKIHMAGEQKKSLACPHCSRLIRTYQHMSSLKKHIRDKHGQRKASVIPAPSSAPEIPAAPRPPLPDRTGIEEEKQLDSGASEKSLPPLLPPQA